MAAGKPTSVCTFVAFIPATLGTVLTVVATTTHYWLESFSERRTGINSMGLWEICFSDSYAAPAEVMDALGKRYSDCNWLLSYELRSLRTWRFSGWFIVVEVAMCLALALQLLSLVFAAVYLLRACVIREQHVALLCAAISNSLAGVLIAVATIIFGYFAGHDSYWLPSPESYYLSWSFGLCVIGGLFAIIAAMFQYIDFSRLQIYHRLKTRAETYAPSICSRG